MLFCPIQQLGRTPVTGDCRPVDLSAVTFTQVLCVAGDHLIRVEADGHPDKLLVYPGYSAMKCTDLHD